MQILGVLHGMSLLACWLNDLPVNYQLVLSLLVAESWLLQRRACETAGFFLRYTAQQGWEISSDGECYSVISVKPSTVVGNLLTVLYFDTNQGRKVLVIFNDAMGANDYRRLIVNLKILECSQG